MIGPSPFFDIPAQRRGQFDLDSSVGGAVDGVAEMLTAERLWDRIEIVDHAVARRKAVAKMSRDVLCQRSVAPTKKEMSPQSSPAIAVHRNNDFDMLKEIAECARLLGINLDRRKVMPMWMRLGHGVKRRAGSFRNLCRNHIGGALKVPPVVGHDAEAAADTTPLGHFVAIKKIAKDGFPFRHRQSLAARTRFRARAPDSDEQPPNGTIRQRR
jgi:hypothetical protein